MPCPVCLENVYEVYDDLGILSRMWALVKFLSATVFECHITARHINAITIKEMIKEYLKMEKDDKFFVSSPKEGKENRILATF